VTAEFSELLLSTHSANFCEYNSVNSVQTKCDLQNFSRLL